MCDCPQSPTPGVPSPFPGPLPSPTPSLPPLFWPSYQGISTFVGASSDGLTKVWYDASLGPQALANAQGLVADATRVNAANHSFFGTPTGKTNVIVFALGGATDGTGGADHLACDFFIGGNIEVDVSYGRNDRVSALYEAELSECSMGGNLCGVSTGEALSRWCALITSNNALADFASGPSWQQAGFPDWVDQTNPTDQDYPSIGCGMVFISWLLSLGYTFSSIAEKMVSLGDGGTLSELYFVPSRAWADFMAAVHKILPITSDDPFHATPHALKVARPCNPRTHRLVLPG